MNGWKKTYISSTSVSAMQSRRTCVNILGTSGITVWQRFACKPTLALQSPPHGLLSGGLGVHWGSGSILRTWNMTLLSSPKERKSVWQEHVAQRSPQQYNTPNHDEQVFPKSNVKSSSNVSRGSNKFWLLFLFRSPHVRFGKPKTAKPMIWARRSEIWAHKS